MAKPCQVCVHPDRDRIEALLRKGDPSQTEICRLYGFKNTALCMHKKNHLLPVSVANARQKAIDSKALEVLSTKKNKQKKKVNETAPTISVNKPEFSVEISWYKAILKDFYYKIEDLYERSLEDKKLYSANQTLSTLLQFLKHIGDHLGFTKGGQAIEINIQAQRVELINKQFDVVMEVIKKYPAVYEEVYERIQNIKL